MSPSSNGYIDQDPNELRLAHVSGALDFSQFTLVGDPHERVCNGISVKLQVIGASHVVTVKYGEVELHEVFACVGPQNVPATLLEDLLDGTVTYEIGPLTYKFTALLIPWEGTGPTALRRLVGAVGLAEGSATHFGVVQTFERADLPAVPKTVLLAQPHALHGVLCRTAHSYPGKGVVMSETIVTISSRGGA